MLIFLLLYIVLCMYSIKFCENENKDYLSKESTLSIKGIFIILVFFSHFNSYVNYTNLWDRLYATVVAMFGQTMVTMFLFYSGYGVMESIRRKSNYIDTIPRKRVLATLLRFDVAVVFFILIGYITGTSYSGKQILLSLLGWETVGNSNWYIFVILLLYVMTYISFKFINMQNILLPIVGVTLMSTAWIGICITLNVKPIYWCDTILCYVIGMLWSIYKEKIDIYFNASKVRWLGSLIVATLCFLGLKKVDFGISALFINLIFVFIVVVFTMRVKIGNQILQKCGELLFEIYILQRIPMILFKYIGLYEFNVYISFIACVIVTLVLIKPFKYLCEKLSKCLKLYNL